jgi:hypothetical protein
MSHGAALPLSTLHTVFPYEMHCAEQGHEPTASRIRSCFTSASGSGSCLASIGLPMSRVVRHFLDLHAVFFLHPSAEPEPVRDNG